MRIHTKDLIMIPLFTGLMVVGAFVRIPFPLLPVTLQPFFCAFAGILLGAKRGALSQIIYVMLGLAGMPVFAQGGGLTYIVNPTFGFLIGFVAGVYIIGNVSEHQKAINIKSCMISVLSGLLTIYAFGIFYMYYILHFYMGKGETSIWYIVAVNLPYIIKDLVLYILVALTAASTVPTLKRVGLY